MVHKMPLTVVKILAAVKQIVKLLIMQASNRVLGRLPPHTDLVGYENLLDWISEKQIHTLDGDVVEIGSFLGGGTVKLAQYFGNHGKTVYTIDIFDPSFDNTCTPNGISMSSLYLDVLRGKKQQNVFKQVTRKYPNIVLIKEDSKKAVLPCNEICFSFIDGCHDPDYVKNDFYLVWNKTVSGGVVGFHDYEGALPQTTSAIDELIESEQDSIALVSRITEKTIILLTKK